MKISVNWMKYYGVVGLDQPIDKLVDKIGAQLGAVEEVIDLGKKYQGIVIAKVVSCEKHPNADKLSVCLIDDDGKTKHIKRTNNLVQVVCGAPNVRAGQLVAWLPPGVRVPSTVDIDPLILEAREIRGVVSNGMLASASELALGDDHSGILELDNYHGQPGDDFAKAYGLDDYIIDIENKMFTHRPDLFGILGAAREVAGIQQLAFNSPDWYLKPMTVNNQKTQLPLRVKVENNKLIPRFMAVPMTIEHNEQSVAWLRTYLIRVGIRPINTIVDITNYMMHLSAQPLHAYDYDKVKALSQGSSAELIARTAKKGEKLTLLGGKEIAIQESDIVIAAGAKVMGLGGVMGGAETEVDENTKNIILECANFDMYAIRRTSMQHGLFTDAVTRFNKGQSALQIDRVLAKTVSDITRLAGGVIAGTVQDVKRRLQEPARVSVTAEFVNERLGTKLSLKDMAKLLENVEFKIMSIPANKKNLHVQPPFWRTDIEIPEDIVEEIGRLYGYQHLPLQLPTRSIKPAERNKLLEFKNGLRDTLAKAGVNELLTYTFVHSDLLKKTGQKPDHAYQLANALSPDLQYYRLSLIPSLLEKVHPNLKSDLIRGDDNEFALFEINPVHAKGFKDKDGLPAEDERLALVFAADDKTAGRKYAGAPYYVAQTYLTTLLEQLGIEPVFHAATGHRPEQTISQAAIAPFDKQRSALVKTKNNDFLGEIGEFSASTRRNLKLPTFSAGFELDVIQLLKHAHPTDQYTPMPRFPKVVQDITLRVSANVAYGDLFNFLQDKLTDLKAENTLAILGQPRIYQSKDNVKHKHITWRLWVSHYERTLKAEEVNKLLDELADAAHATFAAERI